MDAMIVKENKSFSLSKVIYSLCCCEITQTVKNTNEVSSIQQKVWNIRKAFS